MYTDRINEKYRYKRVKIKSLKIEIGLKVRFFYPFFVTPSGIHWEGIFLLFSSTEKKPIRFVMPIGKKRIFFIGKHLLISSTLAMTNNDEHWTEKSNKTSIAT